MVREGGDQEKLKLWIFQFKFLLNERLDAQRVDKIKYLGCIITQNLSNYEHIKSRIKLAYAAAYDIFENNELDDREMSGLIKIQQFKSYIRPILHFGLENF